GKSVSVAAAVTINVQNADVTALVPGVGDPATITVTTPGKLTIKAVNNTTGTGTADGSAVGEDPNDNSAIGVGAAVVVNVVHTKNDATLSGVANVGSLDIEALKLDIAKLLANSASTAIFTDNYAITATSGAGATTLGIAGSLALDLIDTESAASIASTSVVTVSSAGAVMLAADDETASGAVAKADVTGTGKVGIG